MSPRLSHERERRTCPTIIKSIVALVKQDLIQHVHQFIILALFRPVRAASHLNGPYDNDFIMREREGDSLVLGVLH